MKNLLLLIGVLTATIFAQAQTDFYVVDSLYCHSHNGAVETPTERQYNLSFSPIGEVLESRREQYVTWLGQWQNLVHTTYDYDNQGNLIQQVEQSWDTLALAWVNATATENTPNQNGDFTQTVHKLWDGQNWQFVDRINSVFGANGFIETLTQQVWENGNWRNQLRIIYATNALGKFVQTKFQLWNSTTNSFYDVNRQSYFYDNQNPGLEVKKVTEVYDQGTMAWGNSSQSMKSYDSQGNLTEETTQLWNTVDTGWVNSSRLLQNYDAENKLTLRTELIWNQDLWVNTFQVKNLYDTAQNLARFEVSQWQFDHWELLSSCDFYNRFHHQVLAVKEPLLTFSPIPNPYRMGQPIDGLKQGFVTCKKLEVYDLSGKIRFSEKLDNQVFTSINANLPNGLYFVKMVGENGQFSTQKIYITN